MPKIIPIFVPQEKKKLTKKSSNMKKLNKKTYFPTFESMDRAAQFYGDYVNNVIPAYKQDLDSETAPYSVWAYFVDLHASWAVINVPIKACIADMFNKAMPWVKPLKAVYLAAAILKEYFESIGEHAAAKILQFNMDKADKYVLENYGENEQTEYYSFLD